jgi:magnesium chelatase accessory protein
VRRAIFDRIAMSGGLDWAREGRDWPNRESSRFVRAGGLRWHVQVMGHGPALLLVHGTGAATHSWRDLAPRLARHFTVVAPDLPGHGFSGRPPAERASLPGVARSLAALLATLDVSPAVAVGHSAGAAILARMCVDGDIAPKVLVSLNGAFLPFGGWAAMLFLPMARLLSWNPLVPRLFAWRAADREALVRLLRGTGSTLDERGVELYGRLVRSPAHVSGALAMMANWDLDPLERDLRRLDTPLVLVVGETDRTVSPADAEQVAARVPGARVVRLAHLGHLAHEEKPQALATLLTRLAREAGALPRR